MKTRVLLWLLLAATCGAETAEPKPRPRLSPAVVAVEKKRETAQLAVEAGTTPSFRSFDDFLQAEARRPVGLDAVPQVSAARSAAGVEKKELAAKDSPPSPAGMEAASGDVLVLPKMEVNAARLTKLQEQLAALTANQSWEESSAEAWDHRTVVDAILNPPFLRLGGYSGSGRAAVARQRVELLRWVKVLQISQEEAKTPADKARIQADIDGIKDIMRMWE